MNRPLVLALSGLPATGKTTLSQQIGAMVGLPVWSKDTLKERLWDALGPDVGLAKERLGRVCVEMLFAAIETELQAGRGCIVESTFRPALDAPRFHDLHCRFPSRLVSLHCVCDETVRDARFRSRVMRGERHSCHPDSEVLQQGGDTGFFNSGPDAIGPLIFDLPPRVLDTTNFDTIDMQALCAELARGDLL